METLMKEITGNIFDPNLGADAICVTTNGVVKSNGELVMGAGIAKQFAERYPGLAKALGDHISTYGNRVCHIGHRPSINQLKADPTLKGWDIFSFPTKHHWRDPSDLKLIAQSARTLVLGLDKFWPEYKKIILPRPGCGLGGLKWADVKAVIEPILDDRFYIITPK